MATLTYGLMQSLDGYVAGREDGPQLPAPGEALRRYLTDQMRRTAGCLYGRRTYELMRDWDVEHPEDAPILREFAEVWRSRPKWVVSRSLQSVGPKATLVRGDVGAFATRLKAEQQGEIEVAGPELARSLTELGLIDEYRLYLCPVVLGAGRPFFAGPRPRLRHVASETIDAEIMLLRYVPA